jgi:cardiolipin synthase
VLLVSTVAGCAPSHPQYVVSAVRAGEPSFVRTVEAHTLSGTIAGNRVTLLHNGDEIFPAMLDAIRSAKSTITLANFLWQTGAIADQMAEALAERCRAGVGVNVLVDAVGSHGMTSDTRDAMRRSGCHVERFRPLNPLDLRRVNRRNHRRILVVDGRVGFTGGTGIGDEWTGDGRQRGKWRQTDVRIEGPVVRHLQAAFADTWRETTGMLLAGDEYFPELEPRGDVVVQTVQSSPLGGSSEAYSLFLLSIEAARRSIDLTTPYFVPDDRMVEALLHAVRRGAQVHVLIAGDVGSTIDRAVRLASRNSLGRVLEGGVKVYEYRGALLHSKTFVVDSVWASVGSVNVDNFSFARNHELNVTFYDRGVATALSRIFREDLRSAHEVTHDEWKRRGAGRVFEWFLLPVRDRL